MAIELQGSLGNFANILAAVSGLGTAAFGLVDATKAYRGGVSNIGFSFIAQAVSPYEAALRLVDATAPLTVVHANWLNGVDKGTQKAAVKSLVRLGLTSTTVEALARAAPGADPDALRAATAKLDKGEPLGEIDIAALGRFEAILDAQLDAGFERADQQYRNAAKVLAALFAVCLAVVGMVIIEAGNVNARDIVLAVFVGIIATPLAPIAKDLTSALSTAMGALKAVNR